MHINHFSPSITFFHGSQAQEYGHLVNYSIVIETHYKHIFQTKI